MKVLLIICFIVMLLFILANIIWSISLTESETKHKNDVEVFKGRERLFESERASYRAAYEVLAREKEQFKERELLLASRKESVLELEATLLNKQSYISGLESEINAKMDALEKKSIELEEASKAVLDAACLAVIPDVIEPVEQPKKAPKAKKK